MRGRSEKEVAANQFFEICRIPAKEGKRDTDRARGARRSERERARCSAIIAQRVHFGSSHGLKWVETNWLNSNLQRESKNLDRLAKRTKTDGFPALWLKPYGSKQRTAPVPEKVMEMLVFCILSLYWAEMSRKIVPPGFWQRRGCQKTSSRGPGRPAQGSLRRVYGLPRKGSSRQPKCLRKVRCAVEVQRPNELEEIQRIWDGAGVVVHCPSLAPSPPFTASLAMKKREHVMREPFILPHPYTP